MNRNFIVGLNYLDPPGFKYLYKDFTADSIDPLRGSNADITNNIVMASAQKEYIKD